MTKILPEIKCLQNEYYEMYDITSIEEYERIELIIKCTMKGNYRHFKYIKSTIIINNVIHNYEWFVFWYKKNIF